MFEQVIINIIAEILKTDASSISEDTLILEDIGANSLDVIEIITEIEDAFNISIPDEDIPGFKTVGDLVGYVKARK